LILDPGSIALKAGVSMREEDAVRANEGETMPVLLPPSNTCWWRAGRQAACRWLTCCASNSFRSRHRVHRLRPVLNFEGNAAGGGFGGVLARSRAIRSANHRGGLPRGQRHVGMPFRMYWT